MKKTKTPTLVILSILTVITIVIWIVFSIVRVWTKPESIDISSKILKPLSPTLDSESLNQLNQRIFFSEREIEEIISTIPSPSPTASPSPTLSPQPADQEEATQGAETQ